MLLLVPLCIPVPLLGRLQLLRTRATGLGVLTVLLFSDWLVLLLPLLTAWGDGGDEDERLPG